MSKRFVNFDYLRGLAILAVVTIHVSAPTALEGHTSAIILNQIARFGVPIFIFLSGWGLTVSNSYQRSEHYFDFLKRRLSKLLPAYLLWNAIYLLYQYVFHGEMKTISEMTMGVLRGTNFPHLYFVPLIVLFYIAYPLLRRIGESSIGVLLSLIVTIFSLVATWGVPIEGFTRNHNPFNWFFYFVFGIWVANNQETLRAQLNKVIVSMMVFLSLANVIFEPLELTEDLVLTQTRLSVIFYSISVILVVILLPEWDNSFTRLLDEFSTYSFQIYLSHYLFVRLYNGWFPELYSVFMLVLVLLSSYLLAKLVDKRTWSHFLS